MLGSLVLPESQYKDTIPIRETSKFCISKPDTDPKSNWIGSFGALVKLEIVSFPPACGKNFLILESI